MKTLERIGRGLWREVVVDRRAVAAIGAGTAVLSMALAARVRFYLPFTPVPATLQTFFFLVAAASLGPRLATVSLAAYLLLGTVGLPVFTGQWLGHTTGYLVGFVAGGWVVARLTRAVERPSLFRLVGAMLAGLAVVFLFGVTYLACYLKLDLATALVQGLVCFLPGEAVKLYAAVTFCWAYDRRLRQLFP